MKDADDSAGRRVSRRATLRLAAAGLAAVMLPCCADRETRAGDQTMAGEEWDISVCGLNCARCKLLTDQKQCSGCRGPMEENWSPGCEFRPCAETKGYVYCFECDEFPCPKLAAFASDGYEHHRLAVENMKRMRQIGLEAWIAEQPGAMFCPGWHF